MAVLHTRALGATQVVVANHFFESDQRVGVTDSAAKVENLHCQARRELYLCGVAAPRSALRAHKPALQAREREVRTSGPNEGLHVQRGAVDALPNRFHAVAIPEGAPRRELPPEPPRLAKGFDRHGTKREHCLRRVNPVVVGQRNDWPSAISRLVESRGG